MSILTSTLDRLQRALTELSLARRVMAGALVAVMIATGVWAISRVSGLSRSGAGNELEPVLEQPFADGDIARIVKHLGAQSITHKVEDGKVLVPADQKLEVLSDLFYAGVLSGADDRSIAFDALIKRTTAWDAPSKTDKIFNHYREETVERVIGVWAGVRKATVWIDPTNQRHLGGASIQPSAMVDIQTRSGAAAPADRRQLAHAAVNVLTGVIANLSRDRVRVTIDGATFETGGGSASTADASSLDMTARKQQSEQMHVAKVRQLLSYVPGDVLVSVSVDVDVAIPAVEPAVEPAGAAKAGEPEAAVVANAVPVMPDLSSNAAAGSAVAAASAAAAVVPVRTEVVRSASVAVPRSYFVKIYRRANSGTQEPTDALLQPIVDAYSLKIRNLVKNALGLEHDDAVTVEWYEDALPAAMDGALAASQSAASGAAVTAGSSGWSLAAVTANLNTYAREIAFVTLGAVVLTALSLLVRRTAPSPVAVDAHGRQHVPPDHHVVEGTLEDAAGEDDRDPRRAVHPEDAAEAHQLFRRVRDMAQEHPQDAARVLRGWIYQQD